MGAGPPGWGACGRQPTLARGVTAFRILQPTTPGTTYAPAQPLGAERRGGSACGRRAAGEGLPVGASPPWQGVLLPSAFYSFRLQAQPTPRLNP